MTAVAAASVDARSLELELIDPGSVRLVRLYRSPGGHWDPPDEKYRNLRVDPPTGHKAAYAVLYTGSALPVVAMECRVLRTDDRDRYTWDTGRADQYRIVRYTCSAPALFVPIDGRNRPLLGLSAGQRRFAGYAPYQEAALELFRRFGQVAHGLSWESFHRGQPGRVYAIWHHHKPTVRLQPDPAPHAKLVDDDEWKAFLADNPDIEAMDPT